MPAWRCPTDKTAPNELFWRAAVGKSFMMRRWGRAWSPMVELLGGARDRDIGRGVEWDALPQDAGEPQHAAARAVQHRRAYAVDAAD